MYTQTSSYFRFFISSLLLSFLIFSQQNSHAQAFTYHWGHPSPQGNIIYSMAFQDSMTGWAVTGCGQVMKTMDGGTSWTITYVQDSLCNDIYDIIILSTGTMVASGDQGRIMRSTDQGESWQTESFPDAGRLYDLAPVPGGGVSVAGQNGVILLSFDDGLSWINKGPGGTAYARHHYWKTRQEGYVVGYGLFTRTTDGGNSWNQVATPPFFGLNEIYFTDDATGYAVEDFSYWKTTNGGNSWNFVQMFSGIEYRFRTLVLDVSHWFAVSYGEGSDLWETTDAGQNWILKVSYNNIGSPCIVKTGSRLLFGSDLGDIYYTNDGGSTITNAVENLAVFPSAPIITIGKRPDGTLFANNQPNSGTNNGSFFRSDNGGQSWYLPATPPGLRWVYDIQFADNQYGVLGSYGDIRYTLDGGATWNVSTLPSGYQIDNFATPAVDRYFAATYTSQGGGNIYRSADQGASWQAVEGGLPLNTLYLSSIAFANASTGYVSFQNNNQPVFYKTTDGGISWTLINSTGISSYVSEMLWLDENTGLAAVPNGESGIFRTTDGGNHWSKVSENKGRHFSGTIDNRIAVVDARDTFFQESTDNGLSWTPYYPPFSSANLGYQGNVTSIRITENGYIVGGVGNRLLLAERGTNTGIDTEYPAFEMKWKPSILSVWPNPVNTSSMISVDLPESARVLIKLLDAKGSQIVTLLDADKPAGLFTFPWQNQQLMRDLIPGTYFIILQTNDYSETFKMMLAH
jgi:photosystem II stability/assembly factor-like uncharacterized protein